MTALGSKLFGRTRNTIILALLLSVALLLQCMSAPQGGSELTSQLVRQPNEAYASSRLAPAAQPAADPIETKLRSAPLSFLHDLLQRYESTVRDYSCTFIKRERVNGRLRPEQEMVARFKEDPFSVALTWVRRGDSMAQQAVYVKGKLTDGHGNELAEVRPISPWDILAKRVPQNIDGKSAQNASRRSIDQFGFGCTLGLILRYSELAERRGELALSFAGEGQIDGRPTYVLERRLPYTPDDGTYPDALLVVHIDKELLLPTGCFSYASDERTDESLLGSYVWTDIQLNVGLSDADFTPELNGF